MKRKLQIAVLKYLKGREASRSQIIGEISKTENCERQDIQEAVNILEYSGEIGAIKKYPKSILADTFTLTEKGYDVLSPWYKKKIGNLSTIVSAIAAIFIGVLIGVVLLLIEYNFFQ